VIPTDAWVGFGPAHVTVPPPLVAREPNGAAARTIELPAGRYRAWVQGSFATGARLWVGKTPTGDAFNDLGLPSQWLPLGEFEVSRSATFSMVPLSRSLLLPGSRHHELTGHMVVEPVGAEPSVEIVDPAALRRFCGRPVDWVELPA
jgi:hypothetical protein